MIIQLDEVSANQRYFTIIQSLVPRPIAWVLSRNADTALNLARFSYFSGGSSDPPLLMLSIGKKPDGTWKDTRENIVERSDFVVHIPHREQAGAVTESSRSLAANESELDAVGLDTTAFGDFSVPRLADCRIAMACERYRVEDITGSQTMVLGLIKAVYADDGVITLEQGRPKIHADKIDPLARLGGNEYASIGNIIDVPRPK